MNIWKHTFMAMIKNPKSFIRYIDEHKSFTTLSDTLGYPDDASTSKPIVFTDSFADFMVYPWNMLWVYKYSTPENFLIQYYDAKLMKYYIIAYNVTLHISSNHVHKSSMVDVSCILDSCDITAHEYTFKRTSMISGDLYGRKLLSNS